MLSVVIATHENERELAPTLAALVPGAVDGLVSEVIVADGASIDAGPAIAEAVGCRVLTSGDARGARLRAAAAVARASWLLFLRPGTVPDVTWIEELRRFAEANDSKAPPAAVLRTNLGSVQPGIRGALALLLATLRTTGPNDGLLIGKGLYERLGGHVSTEVEPERALLRRLGRRRLVTLRAGVTARTFT
jgi:glycosyltransferase involved in cell wall biosynthesis